MVFADDVECMRWALCGGWHNGSVLLWASMFAGMANTVNDGCAAGKMKPRIGAHVYQF